MTREYAQSQYDEAERQAKDALVRLTSAAKYSRTWRKACDDYEFWTSKKANMWAALQKVAA